MFPFRLSFTPLFSTSCCRIASFVFVPFTRSLSQVALSHYSRSLIGTTHIPSTTAIASYCHESPSQHPLPALPITQITQPAFQSLPRISTIARSGLHTTYKQHQLPEGFFAPTLRLASQRIVSTLPDTNITTTRQNIHIQSHNRNHHGRSTRSRLLEEVFNGRTHGRRTTTRRETRISTQRRVRCYNLSNHPIIKH